MSKQGLIRDLTDVETVYTARLKTICVKLRAAYGDTPEYELKTIANIADVGPVLDTIYRTLDDDQEHFIILILNLAHELVGYKVIASGRQDCVHVDPKLVFRSALLLGAQSIILAHNHPAGNPTPSAPDVTLTGLLVISGRVIEIEVLDHIIYTPKKQLSMREHLPRLFADQNPSGDSPG